MKRPVIVIALLAMILGLSACGIKQSQPETENGYLIYYLAPLDQVRGSDAICGKYQPLDLPEDASLQMEAEAVVRQMMQGDPDNGLVSPLPSEVTLLGVAIQGRRAYVDFSAQFRRLKDMELSLASYCLTLSLTQLEGIDVVSVMAEGSSIPHQPQKVLYERDVLLSTMDNVVQTVEVTLFFSDEGGILQGEQRLLELYEGQTQAENLVATLLAGPESQELLRVIPEDFLIHSIRVEQGVCHINLAETALESLPEESDAQELILWSLANSLYSLENVEQLRLLVNGVELQNFGEIPVSSVSRPQKE